MRVSFFYSFLVIGFDLMCLCYGITTTVKAVYPPKPNNLYPRLIMRGTLPTMSETTVCHWVNSHAFKPKGMYIVSYAHGQAADELLTGVITEAAGIRLYLSIRNQSVTVPLATRTPFSLGQWHHYCVTWSSGNGRATFYLDGLEAGKADDIQARNEIRSGGLLIIGQDQDVYNGKFDLEESWEGYIADVQIWDEKLQPNQILALAKCQIKLEGNVFAWMKTPFSAHDAVIFSGTSLCKVPSEEVEANVSFTARRKKN